LGTFYRFFIIGWKASLCFFVPRQFKMKDVSNDLILITGAGSGIGRLTAIKFAERGANLVLWDIDDKGNAETAKMVRAKGRKAYTYKVDVTNREAVYKTAAIVKQDAGIVTMLLNNAGIVNGKNILDLDDKIVEKVMQVNALSHFSTIKAFLPDMFEKDYGHIVSIASVAGMGGSPQLSDYCASKYAAIGLMDSLHVELHSNGKKNIHTTTICPFFINTGMFDGVHSKVLSVLEPDYVAEEIVAAILCNKTLAVIPRYFYFLLFLKAIIPYRSALALHDAFGSAEAMTTFEGRNSKNKVH